MQQRYYDPVALRFLSPDPVDVSTTDGSNFNRYWYANNNPYRFIDPDGRLGCAASRIESVCASYGWASGMRLDQATANGPGSRPVPGIRPLPIPGPEVFQKAGEALNAVASQIAKQHEERIYVTYTLSRFDGRRYIGRASGYGTPQQVMMSRYASHEWRLLGYGNPQLDRFASGINGRLAIRGREQQLIDHHGGIGAPYVANIIRGVAASNPSGPIYHAASSAMFGEIATYTGWNW